MTAQRSVELRPTELVRVLPTFDNLEIAEWQDLSVRKSLAIGVGEIATSIVTMNDGSRYVHRAVRPTNLTNDVRVEMKTALSTRVSGFNTMFAEIVAEASGSEVSIVGSNQACGSKTSLPQDAWAANLIMIARDADAGALPDERPVLSHGKSRGGMGGNGKIAYARMQGRRIAIGLHEDPSLLHQVGLRETIEGITPLDVAAETAEFVRSLASRRTGESHWAHIKRLQGMTSTFALGPQYLRAQLHTGRALWTGDSGMFLSNMDYDQALVSLMMNKNDLNHREEYGQHSQELPNSHIVDRNYKHIALARPVVIDAGAAAIAEGVKRLDRGEAPAGIAEVLKAQLELRLPLR